MPASAQTPASRRFLPSSSSASVRSQNAIPADPSSTNTRYTKDTSSPFPRTPFSTRAIPRGLEDIDTSVDNDSIDEDVSFSEQSIRQPSRNEDVIQDNSQEPAPLQDTFKTGDIEASKNNVPAHYYSSSYTKRRKTSHTGIGSREENTLDLELNSSRQADIVTNTASDQLDISNSDIVNGNQAYDATNAITRTDPNIYTTEDYDSNSDIDVDMGISTPARPSTSKFRLPTTHTPAPAKAAASTSTLKPTFQHNALRGPHPVPSLILPDAFSPSRRKGALEYIPGGFAETARKWILDLTAQECQTHVSGKIAGNTPSRHTFQIAKVIHDDLDSAGVLSGSFALVEDTTGTLWMLMGQGHVGGHAYDRPRSSAGRAALTISWRLDVGCEILLKGGEGTRWELPESVLSLDRPVAASGNLGTVKVATLWDLASK